jgi:CHAD domain-containing protein
MMVKQNRIVWDANKTASANAALKLPELAARYFQAGRELLSGSVSFDALHRFRLETKRFRYTVELFRPCYGPGLDERLASLEKIQDLLGEINDCVTAQALLGEQRRSLGHLLERRIAQKRRELNRYWHDSFDAAGRAEWWSDYLERFAKDGPDG